MTIRGLKKKDKKKAASRRLKHGDFEDNSKGRKLTPILKVMGNNKNALDRNLFSCTISEIIVRMTPIFPFNVPLRARQNTAAPNERENPNPRLPIPEPTRPIRITRFLPPRRGCSESARRPQRMAVQNWAPVKAAARRPACWATTASEGGWLSWEVRKLLSW